MRNHKKLIRNTVFLSVITFTFLCLSCANNASNQSSSSKQSSETEYNLNGVFTDDDYLLVNETKIVNKRGEEIKLRGVNAGGYLVTESWMCAPRMKEGRTDHLTLTNKLVERFGEAKTLRIWRYYRDNFWGEHDFANCKNMGMNVIRLPFSYMSLDPAYHNVPKIDAQEFNFTVLDNFIDGAARNGLYVVLDMHGAYGSQNGQDHSGQIFSNAEDVDFFSNVEKQNKTIHMWEEIAKHYKGVNSIAGYDLLNEPGEKAGSTEQRHWEFYDKLYDKIRAIDETRPLIMESCWDGGNLPHPSAYDWHNVIYSFHNYSGQYNDSSANLTSYQAKLNGVYAQNFNVPYYMGEFNCYGNYDSWRSTLSYLNQQKWHWTSWTYKLNRVNPEQYAGWGIYYSSVDYIYFDTDSFDDIMDKIYYLDTSHDDIEKMMFDNAVSLEKTMRTYCLQ